jgi:mono/diheme cytochrome c family protein
MRRWPGLAVVLTLFLPGAAPAAEDDWSAPAADRARVAPFPKQAGAVERGKALYVKHCALCHGESGAGNGTMSHLHEQRTGRRPQDLTDKVVQDSLTDGEIFWKISNGWRRQGLIIMPQFATEIPEEDDRWSVVRFVRSLKKK